MHTKRQCTNKTSMRNKASMHKKSANAQQIAWTIGASGGGVVQWNGGWVVGAMVTGACGGLVKPSIGLCLRCGCGELHGGIVNWLVQSQLMVVIRCWWAAIIENICQLG